MKNAIARTIALEGMVMVNPQVPFLKGVHCELYLNT